MVRGPEARPRSVPGLAWVRRGASVGTWAVSCVMEGDLEIREVERAFA